MEFSSERKQHTIQELYEKYQASMPIVLKVKHGYSGTLLDRPLVKGEILVLAVVSKQNRVVASQQCNGYHRILSIPTSFSETMCVVNEDTEEYSHDSYLYSILLEHEIPSLYVRLPKKRTITVGHKQFSADDIPGFYLEKSFEEVNMLGNMISQGKVDENAILAVPIFLSELKVSIVNGIKGHPKKEWVAYQEKLRNLCANVPYDFEYGSNKIAEYSHDMIQYAKDYSVIEPKCLIQLQDLVDIVPVDMIKKMQPNQSLSEVPLIQDTDDTDDTTQDYDEIDVPPDLMPKPYFQRKAPVDEPMLRPIQHRAPPPPPTLKKHVTKFPLLQPAMITELAHAPATNEKLVTEAVEQPSRKRTGIAHVSQMNEKLELQATDSSVNNLVSELQPMSTARLVAKEFEKRLGNVPVKPHIFEKQNLRKKSESDGEIVSCKSNEQEERENKTFLKVPRNISKNCEDETRTGLSTSQSDIPSPTIKTKPSIPRKPTIFDKNQLCSTMKQNKLDSIQVETETCKPGNTFIAMATPSVAQCEIRSDDLSEDGYEYVSLRPAATKTDPTFTAVLQEYIPNTHRVKIYENNLPTQIVSPVKSLPVEEEEVGSVSLPAFDKPKHEGSEEGDISSSKRNEEDKNSTHEEGPNKIDIHNLTIKDVCEYLSKLNLEKYSDKFKEEMIDGEFLLTLDEEVLINEFKMQKIEALRLLRFAKGGTLPK